MSMYETIGNKVYSTLLADPQDAHKIAIPCEPGKGLLKAGLLMVRGDNGLWAPAETNVNGNNIYVVLAEDVDTTGLAGDGITIAEDAAAFTTGRFKRGAVKLSGDKAISASSELNLARLGIRLVATADAAEFNNSVTGVDAASEE